MRRIRNSWTTMLCAIALLSTMVTTTESASILSRSQYIGLWTAACVAGGRSSKLQLSDGERNNIFLVRPFLEAYRSASQAMGLKTPPTSALIREACGCMARYIASRKSNVMAATLRSIADAAADKCLLN